jgi:methionyl-tRNA formyltransferase
MRIAYFGNDIFLDCFQYLINGGRYTILKLFSVAYGEQEYDLAQSTRRLAGDTGIAVQTAPVSASDLEALHRQGCEAIISAGYSHKIPPWRGSSIRYAVNIHPSLLPRGAGPMPLPWVILKGLERTGVTIHKLSDIWDGGDILLQESFSVPGGEHIEALLIKSQRLALRLLERFLGDPESCWRGAVPQSLGDREYWPRLTLQDATIDWNWGLGKIERHLRIYRHARPDGMIEFMTDVASRRTQHSHAPGTLLRQDGDLREFAAREGIIGFRVQRKGPV